MSIWFCSPLFIEDNLKAFLVKISCKQTPLITQTWHFWSRRANVIHLCVQLLMPTLKMNPPHRPPLSTAETEADSLEAEDLLQVDFSLITDPTSSSACRSCLFGPTSWLFSPSPWCLLLLTGWARCPTVAQAGCCRSTGHPWGPASIYLNPGSLRLSTVVHGLCGKVSGHFSSVHPNFSFSRYGMKTVNMCKCITMRGGTAIASVSAHPAGFPCKSKVCLLAETSRGLHSFRKWCYLNVEYSWKGRDMLALIIWFKQHN